MSHANPPSDPQQAAAFAMPSEDAAAPASPRALRTRTARRELTERRRIIRHLRHALGAGGFVLRYQPLVSLSTGRIRGAETLIRLQHSRRGLITPNHFMPVAERSDIITDIGGWTLRQACADASTWPPGLTVGVILSPRHLQSGHLIRQMLEALNRSGLPPERLELEFTEAMLIEENDATAFNLKALGGIGVRLALNHFGRGYASWNALKRLPLSTLRLDRSMIQPLGESPADAAIVHAVIEAGHALGCTILAEGIETELQCNLLRQIGCDEGQGSYFSQPVAAAEISVLPASR
jgi:EAL domain-containing protein (putative c-di-GMP-specific phosphodiesterase class I)